MKSGVILTSFIILNCLIGTIKAKTVTTPINTDVEFINVTTLSLQNDTSARIVGGKNAADGQFPYQISLRESGTHICGGAIITPNYIVTAAHCVTQERRGNTRTVSASSITIRAGSANVNSGGAVVRVSQITPHPQYRNFANDIALMKLATPLTFNAQMKAIPLATQDPPDNADVIISGWGNLRGGGRTPIRLQYVTLKAITNAQCERLIGRVSQSLLCLNHGSGTGACQGDSGGPAAYNGQLVGITNFVIDTCGTNAPDGYAKVSYHNDWLRKNSDLLAKTKNG